MTESEHIDEEANNVRNFYRFKLCRSLGKLSDAEFQRLSQKVVSQMRAQSRLRRVAGEVRELDEAAAEAKDDD